MAVNSWKLWKLPKGLADANHEWAKATAFADYLNANGTKPTMVPIIIELHKSVTAQAFATGDWKPAPPANWKQWLKIPELYVHPAEGLAPTHYCTALVGSEFFKNVEEGKFSKVISRFELGLPYNLHAGDKGGPLEAIKGLGALGKGKVPQAVVSGIIDDGLAYAHEQFRLKNPKTGVETTRVAYFWDQDDPSINVPQVQYGRELTKAGLSGIPGIDKYVAYATHLGLVDEDQVYRETNELNFNNAEYKTLGWRAAHGTHVMHIACGFKPEDNRSDRPIVGVQLPKRAVEDTSGGSLSRHILDGLRYILWRADQIALDLPGASPALPVVVNVSYGNLAGPHDGTSILEAAIDNLILNRRMKAPIDVVLPAGNGYLAACHAQFSLKPTGAQGSTQRLTWRIQPDDLRASSMQIWLPDTADITVKITTPTGSVSPSIGIGKPAYTWQAGNDVLCQALYLSPAATGSRAMINITVARTATHLPKKAVAPSGLWQVDVTRVRVDGTTPVTFDAWIQRGDTAYGYHIRGRQSRFEDPNYTVFDIHGRPEQDDAKNPDAYIKRKGTLSAFATGTQSVVAGGFIRNGGFIRAPGAIRSDWEVAKYSASGPFTSREGPDAATPSEDSPGCYGRLAAGTRSGSIVRIAGTSVAAPQIARMIADNMATGGAPDRTTVQTWAGKADPNPPPQLDPRIGAGRIPCPPVVDPRIEP